MWPDVKLNLSWFKRINLANSSRQKSISVVYYEPVNQASNIHNKESALYDSLFIGKPFTNFLHLCQEYLPEPSELSTLAKKGKVSCYFLSSWNIVCCVPFHLAYLNNYKEIEGDFFLVQFVVKICFFVHMWRNLVAFDSPGFETRPDIAKLIRLVSVGCFLFNDLFRMFSCYLMLDYSCDKSLANKQFRPQILPDA